MSHNILITGGAGFIGSNFAHLYHGKNPNGKIIILDKMTYAADLTNLSEIEDHVTLVNGDIGNYELVSYILQTYKISRVFNFAAESHVDNSISQPGVFMQTNIIGTFNLLRACLDYFRRLNNPEEFKFLHVSTDEVYGTLELDEERIFDEKTPYAPNSPYSASKASSDHIVRSFVHTYNLPCITTNCSNNYGPRQHIEKLIPKTIMSCLRQTGITVYGNGMAVRDWIWVKDHCNGIMLAMEKGLPGQTYCFGGDCERHNIDIIKLVCSIMDEVMPRKSGKYSDLIIHVSDRPGHDMRYAVSSEKSKSELGFKHESNLETTLLETIQWYIQKYGK